MTLLLLLFFLCPLNVYALKINTPYLTVKEVKSDYDVSYNEKIESITLYKLEKLDNEFKYLEKPSGKFIVKTDDYKYSNYSKWQKTKLNNKNLDEDKKTIYYYQELKKINSIDINNISKLLIKNIKVKYKGNIIYEDNNHHIKLDQYYTPEFLEIEVTYFLNQGDNLGSFKITSSDFLNEKFIVKDKGFNTVNIKLINCLTKHVYTKKIHQSTNIDNKFYIRLIKKETLYRYRKIYYKYIKEKETITSDSLKEGYKVLYSFKKYYLKRKETLEFYDNIELLDYLDLDKVIIKSTIPLSKLEFNYYGNKLIVKYQDYQITLNINFKYSKYKKSQVQKGRGNHLKKTLINFLLRQFF